MSTYSPSFSPDFGCLIRIRNELPGVSCTSAQVKSDEGEKALSSDARISPRRVDPKNATTAAVQITCFDKGSQVELAILWPSESKRGKVMTRLVEDFAVERALCVRPLNIRERIASLSRWADERPLIWCANFKADKYVLIDEVCSLRSWAHHNTKCLHVSMDKGQE